VRTAAEARSIQVQTVFDPAARFLRGDASRLQQVVWNLLSNAIRFTPERGRVQVSLKRVDTHVELEVSDTGRGIAPEFLPHVFDPFRQADSSITRQHGGLGLGLAIVRQLVELHGGTVRVASPGENQGATFTVELPLSATQGEEDPAGLIAPEEEVGSTGLLPSLSGLRVLLVEDDDDARQLLGALLENHGVETILASSGTEALALLRSERPDLVVSDIGMPGMDGFEFIRQVRRLPAREGGAIPAIALTAFARSEDRTRALLDGYQLHLAKPIAATELMAALASLRSGVGKRK
jgi:CheY-like chemotaxis protein